MLVEQTERLAVSFVPNRIVPVLLPTKNVGKRSGVRGGVHLTSGISSPSPSGASCSPPRSSCWASAPELEIPNVTTTPTVLELLPEAISAKRAVKRMSRHVSKRSCSRANMAAVAEPGPIMRSSTSFRSELSLNRAIRMDSASLAGSVLDETRITSKSSVSLAKPPLVTSALPRKSRRRGAICAETFVRFASRASMYRNFTREPWSAKMISKMLLWSNFRFACLAISAGSAVAFSSRYGKSMGYLKSLGGLARPSAG
mmetsp:Transcript_37816/g.112903  ORF Transcript_37816/g.112903 Transcript_37816/m.112903 type:complete len:257 (-) Transcript_37816:22-792(-)